MTPDSHGQDLITFWLKSFISEAWTFLAMSESDLASPLCFHAFDCINSRSKRSVLRSVVTSAGSRRSNEVIFVICRCEVKSSMLTSGIHYVHDTECSYTVNDIPLCIYMVH